MALEQTPWQPSNAAIAGHPIHPMLVPLPIAFLSAVLGTDLAYWRSGDAFWARASRALLTAGVVSGAAAAPFGALDLLTIPKARESTIGWGHAIGNWVVLVLSALNLYRRRERPDRAILPTGLILSALAAAIITVTGWLGGELSYRHMIGVSPER